MDSRHRTETAARLYATDHRGPVRTRYRDKVFVPKLFSERPAQSTCGPSDQAHSRELLQTTWQHGAFRAGAEAMLGQWRQHRGAEAIPLYTQRRRMGLGLRHKGVPRNGFAPATQYEPL